MNGGIRCRQSITKTSLIFKMTITLSMKHLTLPGTPYTRKTLISSSLRKNSNWWPKKFNLRGKRGWMLRVSLSPWSWICRWWRRSTGNSQNSRQNRCLEGERLSRCHLSLATIALAFSLAIRAQESERTPSGSSRIKVNYPVTTDRMLMTTILGLWTNLCNRNQIF